MVRKETVSAVHMNNPESISLCSRMEKTTRVISVRCKYLFFLFFTENYNADIYLMIIKDFHSRYLWKLSLDSRPLFYGYIWSCSTKLGE